MMRVLAVELLAGVRLCLWSLRATASIVGGEENHPKKSRRVCGDQPHDGMTRLSAEQKRFRQCSEASRYLCGKPRSYVAKSQIQCGIGQWRRFSFGSCVGWSVGWNDMWRELMGGCELQLQPGTLGRQTSLCAWWALGENYAPTSVDVGNGADLCRPSPTWRHWCGALSPFMWLALPCHFIFD
jgi:hypothetical protein